ncbi:hypothetical protein TW65_06064 [Stemphylium lycopersici]|nr:hypothetical protein TW65_06064 [Stemphylium lycopersici]
MHKPTTKNSTLYTNKTSPTNLQLLPRGAVNLQPTHTILHNATTPPYLETSSLAAFVAKAAPTDPTKVTVMANPTTTTVATLSARQWDTTPSAPVWTEPVWTPPSAVPTPWAPSTAPTSTPDPHRSHTNPETDKSIRITTGTIVGFIFGSMLLFGLIGVVVLCCKRRSRSRRGKSGMDKGLGDVEMTAGFAGDAAEKGKTDSRVATELSKDGLGGGVSGVRGLQEPAPIYKGGVKEQRIH